MMNAYAGDVLVKGTETAAKSYSLWDLFWGADPFVKLIMLFLMAASVFCWTLVFSKWRMLCPFRKTLALFQNTGTFAALKSELKTSAFSAFVVGVEGLPQAQKTEAHVNALIYRTMKPLERHTSLLATMASSAPFIGLLGTVWGIMGSFQSIAATKATGLDVVAPGIAEALAATALGLIVAIPAGMAYNRIQTMLTDIRDALEILGDQLISER